MSQIGVKKVVIKKCKWGNQDKLNTYWSGVPPSDHRPRGHRFERWRVTRRPFCLGKTVFWPPLHRANTGQAVIWPPLYMLNLSTQKAFLMHKRIFKVIYCQWVGQWVISHLRALWACSNVYSSDYINCISHHISSSYWTVTLWKNCHN